MPGLVPGIHVLKVNRQKKGVDGRVKPGHDGMMARKLTKGPDAASARLVLRARQHRADRRVARSREDPGPAVVDAAQERISRQNLSGQSELRRYRRARDAIQSISAVGQPIDLAIVIIPARAVLGALEQCAAVGVKNAVIISSGFAEEGGDSAAMQDAIVALAKRTGMRISGPNAEGFLSEVQKVAATFSPTVDVKPGHVPLVATKRRIAIVAQSGGIGFAIKHRAKALGVAISYCVSAGNESDLGAGEFLDYMVQDASTDVILLFIEGIRDVDKFLAAAQRAAEIGKPVIVTKVGRSGAGERAAASHTASMAGWSAAYDAVFAKYGFIVSNDLDEAVTIAAVLTTNPLPKGDRVAVLTVSGGAGIWGADTVALQGLQVPELSAGDPDRNQEIAAVLWRGRQSDRRHRAGRAFRRPAEQHRSAQRVRRGRRHPGGAVAVERHTDAVQAGRIEAGDRRRSTSRSCSIPTRCRRPSRAANLRPPAPWCCRADACRRRDAADGGARAIQAGAAGRCGGVAARSLRASEDPRRYRNSTASRCCARPGLRCRMKCW